MKNKKNNNARVQELFRDSAQALQQGQYEPARKGFERLSKKVKDSIPVWYNLALANQHLGNHYAAVKAYQHVISLDRRMVDALVNLGMSYRLLGDMDSAKKSANAALKIEPAHLRAGNLLGSVLAEQGEHEGALIALGLCYSSAPNDINTRFNLAGVQLAVGNVEFARELAEGLIAQFPKEKRYLVLLAEIALGKKDYGKAELLIQQLELLAEDDAEEVVRLRLTWAIGVHDYIQVIDLCQILLDRNDMDHRVWNDLGHAYFQVDSIEKAKESYARALKIVPSNAQYANNLGLTSAASGGRKEAEALYRKAIELYPRYAEAYRNLIAMKKVHSLDEKDAQAVMSLWEQRGDDSRSTIQLAFALGKVYDDCGLYEESFEAYEIGNRRKFEESTVNLDAYFAHINRIPEVFDRVPINTVPKGAGPQPVFVLGMPRSGTTLVEQILSRHSSVTGCGELPCIERAVARLEQVDGGSGYIYPNDFWRVEHQHLVSAVEDYQGWVSKLHDVKTPFFVDKMPSNFAHIWLIKSLFPKASVIHCKRHPLDVIISNYFQIYGSDISFVYDLEALANYYARYHGLMEHWCRLFPEGISTINYEDLVSNYEYEVRGLLGEIGLEWEENCLDGDSKATVRTASIWQARQQVYTGSQGRWKNYSDYLQPVADILINENILDEDWNVVDCQSAA